ncbi:hypothetical protein KKF91_17835 [Myxococcota bacterium]|nr:hypothetical protein [Myxococcota bacterium]MBU1432402.1 hypothetical protein [Myxococcota bacterium]MBU1899465.1 hypothetical protein [Myxococcota bacterium]
MRRLALLTLLFSWSAGCDSDDPASPEDATISDDFPELPEASVDPDTGAAGVDGGEADALGGGGGGGEGGGGGLFCDPVGRFGLTVLPSVASEGGLPQFNPRLVFTGEGWGALWLSPGASYNDVLFQRLDADGAPLGEPLRLDAARSPLLDLLYDAGADRFMALWRSERPSQVGVTYQFISNEGVALGQPVLIPNTFTATHFAAGWAEGFGGMIAYATPEGFFLAPVIGEDVMPSKRLFEGPSEGAAVAYGSDGWGCAWRGLDPEREVYDLVFALTDDDGSPYLALKHVRWEDGGAQGYVQMAHGANTYAVGWSRRSGFGVQTAVTLFQGNDVLATPPVPGPETYGLITDITWLPADQFGIAWMDQDDEGFFVGLTTLKTTGQVSTPIPMRAAGHEYRNLAIDGTMTRAYGLFMDEPAPSPTGFSDQVRVKRVTFGDCTP